MWLNHSSWVSEVPFQFHLCPTHQITTLSSNTPSIKKLKFAFLKDIKKAITPLMAYVKHYQVRPLHQQRGVSLCKIWEHDCLEEWPCNHNTLLGLKALEPMSDTLPSNTPTWKTPPTCDIQFIRNEKGKLRHTHIPMKRILTSYLDLKEPQRIIDMPSKPSSAWTS